MSFEVMAWAVKQKTANSGQQLVLLLLANHANGYTGQCNPSHRLLAEECRMGLSTLKNHIKGLEDAGFLKVVHVSKEGVSLPNQYILGGVGQNLADGGSDIDRQVGQNLATKQEIKPVIKPIKVVGIPEGVSSEVWDAFVDQRKRKKAAITELVMSGIAAEAKAANWTLENALKEICVRGWSSFKAEWVAKRQGFVKPPTQAERATNLALGRSADAKLLTPEEQAEREKARLFR